MRDTKKFRVMLKSLSPKQRKIRNIKAVCALFMATTLISCTTSPLGRSQLLMMPQAQMDGQGVAAFDQIKAKTPRTKNTQQDRLVRCVADAVTAELGGSYAGSSWEVVVFDDKSANAFALPGRKIGVHTGLLAVAENQDQLATVVAHEVAHVVAAHPNERVSSAMATQTALNIGAAAAGMNTPAGRQIFGLLGVGAQVGILLPFSRAQESEADLLGLDLMASAGFDPRESVNLWVNMGKAGGQRPPEFMSTHPSHTTRISDLRGRLNRTIPIFEKARAAGKRPRCD